MTKAASYLRVSGKGQIEGDGLPRQREAVARYAKAQGIEVVEEFIDAGVSGTRELDDRDGLSDLFARIRSNGVRVVLVERADRLARDLLVSEVILGEFRRLGVTVIAAEGGVELTGEGEEDPTRKLVRQILGAVAEFDKAVVVSKLRAARIRKRRTEGRCEGRKPYGSTAAEAEVVERMRRLRRKPRGGERMSFAAIADALNAEGIPTRTGKAWRPQTVRGILGR